MIPIVVILLFIAGYTRAQEIPEEIRSNPLYSNADEIINGTKWIFEKKYRGNPFLSDSWVKCDIKYNNTIYTDVELNYDLYKDELIVFNRDEGNKKYVVLPNEYFNSFSFNDPVTNEQREFKYFQLPGTRQKYLYEVAYQGKTTLLIKHIKAVRSRVADGFLGDYISTVELYLKTGEKYESFSKKNPLLLLLGKHSQELKRFMRRNRLKINKKHYKDVAPLLEYFDTLP